ncbi:FkbM family methyltransferase [Streptomyces graminilatus]|uniref:FkbM family methyltransferase n=1 Tax=Streptomyces graminilatus TaxID=1464070 RepID=UPI0006E1F715|nr:FkbM family methyltransferase [Streptomyces graminilatus]
MRTSDQTSQKASIELPDGRTVACVTESEALLLWTEISVDGMYDAAVGSLRPGDTVLDIGANIGLASVFFHSRVPDLRLIAFEPAPQTFACLEENLRIHVPQAVAVRAAVCDSAGEMEFTFYPNSPGNSSLFADRTADDQTTRRFLLNSGVDEEFIDELLEDLHLGISLPVPAVTVSDVIRQYDLTGIGLLKVDVERAELSVLQGIEEAHWPLIRCVAAEVHAEDGRLETITALLTEHGFSVDVSQSPKLAGTALYDLVAHAGT